MFPSSDTYITLTIHILFHFFYLPIFSLDLRDIFM